jgi:hypothetical protein
MDNFLEECIAKVENLKADFTPASQEMLEVKSRIIEVQNETIDNLREIVLELKKEVKVLQKFRDAMVERSNEL